jgi:hypothetical protein
MIRKLIALSQLPSVRVGRCLRLRADDVEALIRRGYTGYQANEERKGSPGDVRRTFLWQQGEGSKDGEGHEPGMALVVERENL